MKKYIENILLKNSYYFYKFKLKLNKLIGKAILNKIKNKGIDCRFEGEGIIIEENELKLGNNVFIGRNFFINAKGKITIGDYTHISRNVVLHTVNHNINGEFLPYDRKDIKKNIQIGNYVWIGMNVNILPGVKIGDGAIIGMGTTVSKDINPGEIVVSSPQRVVANRNKAHTEDLVKNKKFLRK